MEQRWTVAQNWLIMTEKEMVGQTEEVSVRSRVWKVEQKEHVRERLKVDPKVMLMVWMKGIVSEHVSVLKKAGPMA